MIRTLKKVVQATTVEDFEKELNKYEGFATQTHVTANGGILVYTGVIFLKEEQ